MKLSFRTRSVSLDPQPGGIAKKNKTKCGLSLVAALVGVSTLGAIRTYADEVKTKTDTQAVKTISNEKLGFTLSLPAEWEVRENAQGMAVVASEPELEKPVYNKPTYRKNITLTVHHEASPIDKKSLESFKKEMTEIFEKDVKSKNFQILDAQLIDFKSKKDAVLLYTAFDLGDFPMMQMLLMTSSAEKRFVLSYIDLQTSFNNEESFQKAWTAFTSLNYDGIPPKRVDYLRTHLPIGVGVLFTLIGLLYYRRRRAQKYYERASDVIYEDEPVSTHFGLGKTSMAQKNSRAHSARLATQQNSQSAVSQLSLFW